MSSGRDETECLDRLVDELRLAPVLTPPLISRVFTDACTRAPGMARTGEVARLERLMLAEAWIDVVLFLMELELPGWRPCRLVYDDGEWVCSLSRHPDVPFEFDDTVDGRHEETAVAILLAFVEAKRLLATSESLNASCVPQITSSAEAHIFLCDDFA